MIFIFLASEYVYASVIFFFFQAEDGIRDLVRSRGLGDVYKRQLQPLLGQIRPDQGKELLAQPMDFQEMPKFADGRLIRYRLAPQINCLLYTSDAADERSSVDLGGRRVIKKKNTARAHGRLKLTKE